MCNVLQNPPEDLASFRFSDHRLLVGSATVSDECVSHLVTPSNAIASKKNMKGWQLECGSSSAFRRYCYESMDSIGSLDEFARFSRVGIHGLKHSTASTGRSAERKTLKKVTSSNIPNSAQWDQSSAISNLSLSQLRRILHSIKNVKRNGVDSINNDKIMKNKTEQIVEDTDPANNSAGTDSAQEDPTSQN